MVVQGSLYRADGLYRFGASIAVLNAFLSPILQDFKLLQISPWIPAALFYAGLPAITACFCLSLYLRRDLGGTIASRFDALEITLLVMMLWSWVWVAIYGGDIGDIGGNFLRVLFAFSAYRASRLFALDPALRTLVPRLAKWGFWGVFLALVGLYVLGVFGPFYVYLSLNTEEVFVAFAVALTLDGARRAPFSLAVFAMVVLGGRRGAIVAALAMVALKYAMNWGVSTQAMWKRALLIGIAGCTLLASALGVKYAQANPEIFDALPPNVALRIAPLVLASDTDEGIDATTLTGKRNVEVMAVFDQWASDPLEMLTGQGYGATWVGEDGERDSTVHFSPVAVALIYGIPLATLLYGIMLYLALRAAARAIRGEGDREEQIWALVVFGLIVLSLTGFSIFQNYVLWIGLGILRAFIYRPPTGRKEWTG